MRDVIISGGHGHLQSGDKSASLQEIYQQYGKKNTELPQNYNIAQYRLRIRSFHPHPSLTHRLTSVWGWEKQTISHNASFYRCYKAAELFHLVGSISLTEENFVRCKQSLTDFPWFRTPIIPERDLSTKADTLTSVFDLVREKYCNILIYPLGSAMTIQLRPPPQHPPRHIYSKCGYGAAAQQVSYLPVSVSDTLSHCTLTIYTGGVWRSSGYTTFIRRNLSFGWTSPAG